MPRITLRKRRGSKQSRRRQSQRGGAVESADQWITAVRKIIAETTDITNDSKKLGEFIKSELKLPQIENNDTTRSFNKKFDGAEEDIRRQGDVANSFVRELLNVNQNELNDISISKFYEKFKALGDNGEKTLRSELMFNFLMSLEKGLRSDEVKSDEPKYPLYLIFLIMNVTYQETQLLPQSVDLRGFEQF